MYQSFLGEAILWEMSKTHRSDWRTPLESFGQVMILSIGDGVGRLVPINRNFSFLGGGGFYPFLVILKYLR